MSISPLRVSTVCLSAALCCVGLTPARADEPNGTVRYAVTPLVSDGTVSAPFQDPNLKNPWGIAFNPTGFVWVANNHTGTSTLYDGSGKPQQLVVTVPGAGGAVGAPTGIVFSASTSFVVTKNGLSGPGRFIFAGEDGTISAWAPNVDATNAVLAVDNSAGHSVYKGLALASNGQGNFLFATDFHHGRVDVFDAKFQHVNWSGAFVDPKLPVGYAPFGIQNLQGNLYVSYAKHGNTAGNDDEVAGPGLGLVDVFSANGMLIRRVATAGRLNAPWGLTLAPADFGAFSNALLVGNFGDGRISAFDARTGDFLGQLRGTDNQALVIDGLWGFAFGNGVNDQSSASLFFTAGVHDEAGGLYGRIDPMMPSAMRTRALP